MNENFFSLRKQTVADSLLIVAVVMAVASLLIRQFNDSDVWWLLAIGRDIIANKAIPHIDHFTAAGWGREYHDSHWLFQVALAGADRLGGTIAVGSFAIAVWSAAFVCSYRSIRRWLSAAASCLLLFIVALACNYRFMPRPDIVSCFMITIFYLRLQSGRYRTTYELALFGVLQIVWSNSHGLFVLGPFMAGCYVAEAAWNTACGRPAALKQTLLLLAVLLLAAFVTPFGLDGWRYAVQIAHEAGPFAHAIYKELDELRPVFQTSMLSNPDGVAFFLILVTAAFTIIPSILKKKASISRLLIVAALLATAVATGRRNIPLFSLVAIPLIAESIGLLWPGVTLRKQLKYIAAIMILCFTALPLSGLYYQWFNYNPLRFGIGAPAEYQPAEFPAFLRETNFTGQIYNNDIFGGYCLYHGILPLIDGRWEVYDQKVLATILRAPFDQTAWDWVVNRYDIKGALLLNGERTTQALVSRFIADNSFQMVYQDSVSTFFLRRSTSENKNSPHL